MKLINNKFPSKYKLKSKLAIEKLFKEGKTIKNFPLKLVFLSYEFDDSNLKIGFSVPKKLFKKAVDRNRLKRMMREVFRNNKEAIFRHFENSTAIMLIYMHNEKIDLKEMEEKYFQLLEKTPSTQK